ncbi:MAG: T9SS type A sorting domain-containing protein [Ignavibacteria bacterium]|nr:T9SS type A sorting domain-containing protein [Ignavibacteria bacterium]
MKTIAIILSFICTLSSLKADQHWKGPQAYRGEFYGNNENIFIDSTILSNGYKIEIYNCNVYVAQGSQIKINTGDTLICDYGESAAPNIIQGQGSQSWCGIYTENAWLKINHTRILNATKNYSLNSNYTIICYGCKKFEMTYSTILPHNSSDSSASGVLISYPEYPSVTPNFNIDHDSILVNTSSMYALNIYNGYTRTSGTFYIANSVFKNTVGASTGVLLEGLESIDLNANEIRDWSTGVYSYSSTMGLRGGNQIRSTYSVKGLDGRAATIFDLSSDAGGYNTLLTNTGNIIDISGSYFKTNNGGNVFVKQDTSAGYFFKGDFAATYTSNSELARGNCFLKSIGGACYESSKVAIDVVLSNNSSVNFSILPYSAGCCPEDKPQINSKDVKSDLAYNIQRTVSIAKTLSSQVSENLKAKNYSAVHENSKKILEMGIDGMESVDAVRKMFLSMYMINSGEEITERKRIQAASEMKFYLEQVIKKQPVESNTVNEIFYYIQKCKVICGEYQSALDGFKTMMTKGNKTMLAKWNYESLRTSLARDGKLGIHDAMSQQELNEMILRDIDNSIQNKHTSDNITHSVIPGDYILNQNYPNPFNPVTNIQYLLPKQGFVSLKVYDVVGRMIKELVSELKEAGNYSVTFDATNFSSGVYFYRIEVNGFVDTKRMVLMK